MLRRREPPTLALLARPDVTASALDEAEAIARSALLEARPVDDIHGRLAETAAVARAFAALAAAHRGEITAEVTSAHALSPAQMKALSAKLKERVGRDVAIDAKIDPAILGGLTVKIGSTLIDNSIRTRLNTLATAMKG